MFEHRKLQRAAAHAVVLSEPAGALAVAPMAGVEATNKTIQDTISSSDTIVFHRSVSHSGLAQSSQV